MVKLKNRWNLSQGSSSGQNSGACWTSPIHAGYKPPTTPTKQFRPTSLCVIY